MTDKADAPCSVLVVDDDERLRTRLGRALTDRGFEVRLAANEEEAVALAAKDSPERAIVDMRMSEPLSGLSLVRKLKEIDATTNIVVLTGYGSIATALEAVRLGARDYLTKPASVDAILAAFEERAAPLEVSATVPTLARVEWEHIQRVLADCQGNVSAAARALGIHRRSLQRKLSKFPTSR